MKKKITIIFSIVILIIVFFGVYQYKLFGELKNKIDNDKFLEVSYVITDTNPKTHEVKIGTRDYNVLKLEQVSIPVSKKNDYYYAYIDVNNSALTENILDYVITKNNTNGEVVSDVSFDINKKFVKIPKKYFTKDNDTPIRVQLLSRMSEKKLKNTGIELNIFRFLNVKKNITVNSYNDETSFSIKKYKRAKNIKKNDITIYINDYKIDNEMFDYNSISSVINLKVSPLVIKKINVVIKKKTIIPFLNIKDVNAIEAQGTMGEGSSIGIPKGTKFSFNAHIDYNGSSGQLAADTKTLCDKGSARQCAKYKAILRGQKKNDDGSYKYVGGNFTFQDFLVEMHGWDPTANNGKGKTFVRKTTDSTGKYTIVFEPYLFIYLGCDESTKPTGNSESMPITLTVTSDKTSDYITFNVTMNASYANQEAKGSFKMKYPEQEGTVKVKKVDTSTNKTIGGIKFGIYNTIENCNKGIVSNDDEGLLDYGFTNDSTGLVTFDDGLTAGTTYYIKEQDNDIYKFKQWNTGSEKDTNACHAVVAQKTVKNADAVVAYNDKKYYSFSFNKVDIDNNSTLVSGSTYDVYFNGSKDTNTYFYERMGYTYKVGDKVPGASCTDNGSGTITCCGLPDIQSYRVEETQEHGVAKDSLGNLYCNSDRLIERAHTVSKDALSSEYIGTSCPGTQPRFAVDDNKYYYCARVKKVDALSPNPALSGAVFTAQGLIGYNSAGVAGGGTLDDGYYYFFKGSNYLDSASSFNVREETPPLGYSASTLDQTVAPVSLGCNSGARNSETISEKIAKCNTAYGSNPGTIFEDEVLVMNWYKIDEDGNAVKTDTTKSAKFKVKTTGGYLKFGGKVPTTDANGTQKMCYQYDKTNTGTDTLDSDENGEVCVRGIPQGTYTVEEVQPAQYHTFGNSNEITLSTSTIFSPKTSSNVFINLPTTFKFKKYVAKVDGGDGDEKIVVNGVEKTLTELTTEELKKIDFQIFNSAGQVMDFYYDEATGKYNFGGNVIDPKVSQTGTNILHLNNDRDIIVDHLPWGETFTIKEVQSKVCDPNASEEDCIGYYYPNYNEQGSTFTVTTCSNDGSGIDKCPSTNKVVILGLTNTPTEINFTKRDFYGYNDQADIEDKDRDKDKVDSSVEFENAKERSDFDRITFKLKNKLSGKYLTLKFVKNHGNCKTDDSYAEYRYVLGDQSDPNGTELHTCGGHIKITNLCRGNEYTVEEISVPEDSVYVKEKDENGNNPSVDYKVACTDGSFTPESTTHIINDKPTRVRFEKRDSKYNYLIPDETTTFKLYRCKKGEECHPGDYSTDKEREAAGMELVKFYDRGVITNDEEDPSDAEGLAGVEVYRRMSDSDAEAGAKVITDLHPYKGILVMRYLQANYNYVLLETVAPKNYQLPLGRNAETPFKPVNDTVDVDPVDVPNKPTSLLIKKYDSKGNLLPGAEFKIYEGTSCDKNLSAMNQPKKELKLKTIRDGIYENRETKDTDIVKTCKDREDEKCSDINPNGPVTNLTYSETVRNQALNNSYLGSFADFADDSTATKDGKKIEINEGTALIQYLEYGHCYIIEETKAPEGHSLPAKTEDRFTMVTIDENDAYAHSTYYKFINKPTPFQFYKYDEFNQLLDGAEFKLQKLDDNKKYQDVTVSLDEDLKKLEEINDDNSDALNNQINNLRTQAEEGVPFYRVDSETDNKTITTKNGTAVVYYLSQGQYRIIETKPAPGKELTKNPNIATFFVDDSGNVYGNSIIVNKAKTERIEVKNSASAELIVNIQTGQTVIRYGLIIAIIAALITGLMILKNKMK